MTGNELNYAFQQTVSSEYTFGSGDKLIDSFPSWPDMKKFFNPYDIVTIYFTSEEIPNTIITNSGIDTSFAIFESMKIEVKLKISAPADFINGPFYYKGKEYRGSDVLFNVVINNIGNRTTKLYFKGSDMVYDDINFFIYEKTIIFKADGKTRKLYYSPRNYMTLQTSERNVTLNDNVSVSQLYTY